MSNCEFVTFPLVSWVRCGTWLYRFLIFAVFLTCISQSPILFDSLRWDSEYFGKKLNCKNYHFQELCFSKVSNVRSTGASFGKPHLSLILTNQCLTIMVRSGTVINIVPLWWHYTCADSDGDRGPPDTPHPHPLENNKYVYGFLWSLSFGPCPWKKLDSPPPPPPLEIMAHLLILGKV